MCIRDRDEHCEINVLLFDGLTDHDGDNQIIPRLAKSWEYDEENLTYTFHLEAVSYTHLDVYKRQGAAASAGVFALITVIGILPRWAGHTRTCLLYTSRCV